MPIEGNPDNPIEAPAPTPWPMLMALGLTLAFAGLERRQVLTLARFVRLHGRYGFQSRS